MAALIWLLNAMLRLPALAADGVMTPPKLAGTLGRLLSKSWVPRLHTSMALTDALVLHDQEYHSRVSDHSYNCKFIIK